MLITQEPSSTLSSKYLKTDFHFGKGVVEASSFFADNKIYYIYTNKGFHGQD